MSPPMLLTCSNLIHHVYWVTQHTFHLQVGSFLHWFLLVMFCKQHRHPGSPDRLHRSGRRSRRPHRRCRLHYRTVLRRPVYPVCSYPPRYHPSRSCCRLRRRHRHHNWWMPMHSQSRTELITVIVEAIADTFGRPVGTQTLQSGSLPSVRPSQSSSRPFPQLTSVPGSVGGSGVQLSTSMPPEQVRLPDAADPDTTVGRWTVTLASAQQVSFSRCRYRRSN